MPSAPRRVRRSLVCLAPLALLVAGACATARPPLPTSIVTDRPDFTESAVTVPRGYLQLETGTTYADEADVRGVTVGEALLRAGLTERVELRLVAPSYVTMSGAGSSADGFSDLNLGAKFALFAPADGASRMVPTVGLIAGSTLPTGTGGLEADGLQPEAKLLLAWTVTDRFSVASNLNYARVNGIGDDDYNEPSASFTGALALSDAVGSYLELYGFAPDYADAPRPTYVNTGLTWLLTRDLQLDARVGVGIHDARDSRFVGVGLSRRW